MLNHLDFDITFPKGNRIRQSIDFKSGMTTITGPNGKGKSLILEMVCFALWGIKAVRGASDDYKKCKVELHFSVKGDSYRVERSGTNATLYYLHPVNDEQSPMVVATGTTPVNQKIASIFGYQYSVFAVANLIGQGQIEALSTMQPSERKKLIDTTIGLDAVDLVIRWCGEQASLSNREVEALTSVLIKPEEPTKPDGYVESHVLKDRLAVLSGNKTVRDRLVGWLANAPPKPSIPVWDEVVPSKSAVDNYNALSATRSSLLNQISAIPEASLSVQEIQELREQLTRHEAWSNYDTTVSKLPQRPALTRQEIDEQQSLWAEYDAWKSAVESFNSHKVTCPNCSHEFSPKGQQPVAVTLVCPNYTKVDLTSWRKDWDKIDSKPAEPSLPRPSLSRIDFTNNQLNTLESAANRAEDRKRLVAELEGLSDLGEDPTPTWNRYLRYEAALDAAQRQQAAYDAWEKEAEQKRAELLTFANLDEEMLQLQVKLEASTAYEAQSGIYNTKVAAYDAAVARVAVAAERATEMKKAANALKELKLKVKTFLVPSLNRVASHLVRLMTEGQYQEINSIVVDEEFNITVDGQKLETLNGSGKTVANLALRIALGQILTNKVFSVLMVDEVDAACDNERAEAIADCLRGLVPTIKQVISVTHKSIQADNYIEV